MLIYGAVISPFVRKVHVAAREKGVAYTSAASGDPTFAAASPFGKIPAIRDGDFTLADSTAIALWLDAAYPGPSLIPADPAARGRTVWFDEVADTVIMAAGGKVLFHRLIGPRLMGVAGDEAVARQGLAELPRCYAYLEGEAARAGDGWLVGAAFTLADIAVASALRSLDYVTAAPDPATYPATAAWRARVHARPAWQAVAQEEAATAQRLGLA